MKTNFLKILIAISLAVVVFFRFTENDILSSPLSDLFGYNAILFIIVLAIIFAVFVKLSIWWIKYNKGRGVRGELNSALWTIRLGIMIPLIGLLGIGLILWGLSKLLLYISGSA